MRRFAYSGKPWPQSLDDLVGAAEQRHRKGETQRLGGLQVDHQLELCRLFDRQIGRLGASQDLIYLGRGATVHVREVRPV